MSKQLKKFPELKWVVASLQPAAQSIFSRAFLPPGTDITTARVYCALTGDVPEAQKVLVVSRMAESAIRIITTRLASSCITVVEDASAEETDALNDLISPLNSKAIL